MKNYKIINGFKIFHSKSRLDFINFVSAKKMILLAVNAEKIYHSNPILKKISKDGIAYPDGIGAVIALKLKGVSSAIRIPGCELWLDIIKNLKKNKTFYIIGSKDSVLKKVILKLESEYEGIKILGYRNGYFNPNETKSIIFDLKAKKPDIVFVALGSPKQEKFMLDLNKHHKAMYMGLGGSLDVFSNEVKRAPKLFGDNGLEWLYRLISNPFRIKRQMVLIPFLFNLIRGKY